MAIIPPPIDELEAKVQELSTRIEHLSYQKDVLQIVCTTVIMHYGEKGVLAIPDYKKLMDGMPNRTLIYAEVHGDDLVVYSEAVDDETVTLQDVMAVESSEFN